MIKLIFVILIFLYSSINDVTAQNPCAGVFAGSVPHPDPRRCSEFYVCIFFIGSLQNCQANHIFDGTTGNCIPGDPSTCLPYTSPLPETTTALPSTTTSSTQPITTIPITTTQSLQTTTSNSLDLSEICRGVFFAARPHPQSVYLFVGCIRGSGTEMSCFNNEYFDVNVFECLPIPTTPAPCSVPDNVCEGKDLDLIAHPCECSKYIVCHFGSNIMVQQCGPEEIFDPNINECRPGNWNTCQFYPVITPSTTVLPDTTTLQSHPCDGVLLGNRPMPGSCTLYFRCILNEGFPQQCPPNHVFDREELECIENGVCILE